MISSRDIKDLHPKVQGMCNLFLKLCKKEGIDILVISTYRDFEAQTALYNQGRTTPGKIVTKAKAGESFHNYRLAFDVVPLVYGKCFWDTNASVWAKIGDIGVAVGLEWAGNWKTFRELPHFQYTAGLKIKDLKNGATL
jgi:peptidoglycan L-alanyl-D-glutamate endopeptidase CwlK